MTTTSVLKTSAKAANHRTVKFIGHIETISPVTVALPNNTGIPKNTHGAAYIPASSIRGMLRHTAHFAIAQLLAKQDKHLSVDEHFMLASGIDTAQKQNLKGNGTETIAKNQKVREANPAMSLFGSFVLDSRLKVGNAVAEVTDKALITLGNGSRSPVFSRTPELLKFVAHEELDYLHQVMSADKKTAAELEEVKSEMKHLENLNKTSTAEEKKENFARIDELKQIINETKDSRVGSRESIRFILPGFEAIDQGVKLSQRMTLSNPTDDEIAFLLWVLTKASVDFNIGGHRNLGCGDIKAKWTIVSSSFDHPEPQEIGKITIDDTGLNLEGLKFDYKGFEEKIISGGFDFTQLN